MKPAILAFTLATFALSTPGILSRAHAQMRVFLQPELGTAFGQSDFELRFSGIDQNGQDVQGKSVLEWPVDFMLVGYQMGLELPASNGNDYWVVAGRLTTNIDDARGTMDDSDYAGSRGRDIAQSKFAFTKSETRSNALFGELSAAYRFERTAYAWSLLGGYRHEYYDLSALGGSGFYPDDSGAPMKVSLPRYLVGADYTAHHALPFIGARIEPKWQQVEMPTQVRGYYLYDHSTDDHRLRGKEAVGTTHGVGASIGAFPALSLREGLSLGLSGEVFFYKGLRGVLEQSFYADDESTPENETEQSIPDSKFFVQTLRVDLCVFLRVVI